VLANIDIEDVADELRVALGETTSEAKRKKIIKRLKVAEAFRHSGSDPAWMVLKKPEYARHSDAFKTAVRALHDAAAKRDLEATPQAYVAVTMSCVECHRYLARNRIAR